MPKRERVGTDGPDDGQRALAGADDQEDAEGDREDAAEDQQPFVGDGAAQLDRRDDLDDAGEDCPPGDEGEQHQRGDPRPNKGENPGDDADDPFQDEEPGARLRAADQREEASDQGVGGEEDDQRRQGEAGSDEGGDPEEDGEEAAQGQRPPVPCDVLREHRSPPERLQRERQKGTARATAVCRHDYRHSRAIAAATRSCGGGRDDLGACVGPSLGGRGDDMAGGGVARRAPIPPGRSAVGGGVGAEAVAAGGVAVHDVRLADDGGGGEETLDQVEFAGADLGGAAGRGRRGHSCVL